MSFLRRLELEAWRLELAALGRGRLLFFNLRLNRARSAASPVFQFILIYQTSLKQLRIQASHWPHPHHP